MEQKGEWGWLVKHRRKFGYLIIVVGLLVSYYWGFTCGKPLTGLGIIGIGTFLSTLTGTFLLTKAWDLSEGEFRKALTIAIVSIFFYSLAIGDQIPLTTVVTNSSSSTTTQTNILSGLFTNLWAIVLAVVTFYFTARAVETIKK